MDSKTVETAYCRGGFSLLTICSDDITSTPEKAQRPIRPLRFKTPLPSA